MPLIATSAVGEAQDVREGGGEAVMEGSALKPDDRWIYKHPSWVLMLLRGQWETDGAVVYSRCSWQQSWLQLPFLTKVVSMLDIGKVSAPERSWLHLGAPLVSPSLCPGTLGDVYSKLSIQVEAELSADLSA